MFWNIFWNKKQIDENTIRTFSDAIKAIKTYTYLQEWEKAKSALEDIRIKESEAFEELEQKIKGDYKEVQKQRREYDKKLKTIESLEKQYETKKIRYEQAEEKKRFDIRFKKIKQEILKLIAADKNTEALNLLNHFLEENQSRSEVVTYYAKQKKKILRSIEKRKVKDKKKAKDTAEIEALRLAGITLKNKLEEDQIKKQEKLEEKEKHGWRALKNKFLVYKQIRQRYEKKKLLDEVRILIEEENKVKDEIATKKLEHIHQGLIKEMERKDLVWFDIYWKILGSDKISGDSFSFVETKNKYNFYIGDATGHGVRAGLIISLLSKTYQDEVIKEDIINLTLKINNTLKENLQSKNFATGLLFELDKNYRNAFNVSGMGHEPLFIYRAKTKKVEKIIAGGLAAGIRMIKNPEDIKPKTIELDDGDIVLSYSDGVIEARENDKGEIYGLEKLQKSFGESCQINGNDIKEIYADLIDDLKLYKWGSSFSDDTTILLFKRNKLKDQIAAHSDEMARIKAKEGLSSKDIKRLSGKTQEQIKEELTKIKKEKETLHIISILKSLYYTGEFLKLKEEATRYIKDGYIHKDINFYLKKAIENEDSYKIKQKNTKMENKYNVLVELYKEKRLQHCDSWG